MNIAEASALLAAFLASVAFLLAVPGREASPSPNAQIPAPENAEKPLIGEPPGWHT